MLASLLSRTFPNTLPFDPLLFQGLAEFDIRRGQSKRNSERSGCSDMTTSIPQACSRATMLLRLIPQFDISPCTR